MKNTLQFQRYIVFEPLCAHIVFAHLQTHTHTPAHTPTDSPTPTHTYTHTNFYV